MNEVSQLRSWRVKERNTFFWNLSNPKDGKFELGGAVFQAERTHPAVLKQRHKLMDVTPSVEALPKKTTPTTTRRGRKPKVTTMMPEPTAERTMNQDSLFESE